MKKTKISRGDSRKKQLFIRRALLQGMLIGVLLLTGCKNNDKQVDATPTPTEAITATVTPSITTAPTIEPTTTPSPMPTGNDNSSNIDESTTLTEDDARSLIESKLDLKVYSTTLLSKDVVVENKHYYSFQVKDKDKAIEPSLVVNKVSGEIYCYDKDGKISDYSNFPLYNPSVDAVCDWNGIFERLDANGKANGSISLAQGDPNSFEFTLDITYEGKSTDYFGIASIQGNTAKFKEDSSFTLNFVMKENELTITESGENPFTKGLFEGTYKLSQE